MSVSGHIGAVFQLSLCSIKMHLGCKWEVLNKSMNRLKDEWGYTGISQTTYGGQWGLHPHSSEVKAECMEKFVNGLSNKCWADNDPEMSLCAKGGPTETVRELLVYRCVCDCIKWILSQHFNVFISWKTSHTQLICKCQTTRHGFNPKNTQITTWGTHEMNSGARFKMQFISIRPKYSLTISKYKILYVFFASTKW